MDNTGLENVGPNRKGGKYRTGKHGNIVCMGSETIINVRMCNTSEHSAVNVFYSAGDQAFYVYLICLVHSRMS